MPWIPDQAPAHTKKATNERLRKLWAETANASLAEHGDDGLAAREANRAVKKESYQKEFHGGKKRK